MKKINLFRSLPLKKRLNLIAMTVFFPMVILVVFLLISSYYSSTAYNQIIRNVTYANQYSRDFKERIDYTMYLAVIDGKSTEELGSGTKTVNGIVTVDPYAYIKELSSVCDKLSEIATVNSNKKKVRRLKRSLSSLEKNIKTLEQRIQEQESYDENLAYLDENIYMLTSIIQEGIREYVYLETTNLETVRLHLEETTDKEIKISILLVICIAFFSIGLSKRAEKSITDPIEELCVVTGQVARGDFTPPSASEEKDEISVLTNSFNRMTGQIARLVEDIRWEQQNLRITEVKLLQAQINPHFLYNTLDTIIWLAEQKQTEEVVRMVTALSDFFRTTLSEGKDYIRVAEEESHIRSYLEIQKFRYQDIMDYEIKIDEEIGEYGIPKLTLQPFVENALYHGIKNKRGKGRILVTGSRQEDSLLFQIRDNGIGMDEATLGRIQKRMNNWENPDDGRDFGIANVNMRIKYFYGETFGVSFESKAGEGTCATVTIGLKNIKQFTQKNIPSEDMES